MGSGVSKQARTLPQRSSQVSKNQFKRITNHKVEINHNSIDHDTLIKTNKNDRISLQKDQTSKDAIHKNSFQMGSVKVHEVPLSLDQNHPALQALRNKTTLEDILKDPKNETNPKSAVTQSEFCAIVEDLSHYNKEQIDRNYNLDKNFVNILKQSGIQITTTKVEVPKEKKISKKSINGLTPEQVDENRINGIRHPINTKMEDALETLMNPKH